MTERQLFNIIKPILQRWIGNMLVVPSTDRIARMIAKKIIDGALDKPV